MSVMIAYQENPSMIAEFFEQALEFSHQPIGKGGRP